MGYRPPPGPGMGHQPIPPPMSAWSDAALADCVDRNRFAETWLLKRPHRRRRALARTACLLLIPRRQAALDLPTDLPDPVDVTTPLLWHQNLPPIPPPKRADARSSAVPPVRGCPEPGGLPPPDPSNRSTA